jgi:hypothetical protein
MSFNAHDLKVAFDDGVMAERARILEMLRNTLINDKRNDTNQLETLIYSDYLDIGEI